MLIITYFNRILGSEIYLTAPKNLLDELNEEIVDQLKTMIYNEEEGFFVHNFSTTLKTANRIFKIDSKWARGRTELVLASVIVSEEEPDYSFYESLLNDFVNTLKSHGEIYKAFYKGNAPETEQQSVKHNFKILKTEVNKLQKRLSLKNIETEGMLTPHDKIVKNKYIQLSDNFLSRIQEKLKKNPNKSNFFIIYRARGETIKIEIIPTKENHITKIMIIFGEQMNINVLHQISKVFSNHEEKIKLIYTTGVCRETDKCLYEIYVHMKEGQLHRIQDQIKKIPGIISIESREIKLNE